MKADLGSLSLTAACQQVPDVLKTSDGKFNQEFHADVQILRGERFRVQAARLNEVVGAVKLM